MMSHRINLLHQGMLGKIGEKVSDITSATKISLDSTAVRKNVSDKPDSGGTGRAWTEA